MQATPPVATGAQAIDANVRIDGWEVQLLSVPLTPPFLAAVRRIDSVDLALVRLQTRSGAVGHGLAFGFGVDTARAIAALLPGLLEPLRGEHPVAPQAHWRRMCRQLALTGTGGPAAGALHAVDMALWDLAGQLCGQPLWRLLGGARTQAPVYGSGGSLALDTDALVREMQAHAAAGLRAVKLKLGHGVQQDLHRVRAVREALGPHIRLAADANQQWRAKEALRHAEALQALGLWWLEEPVPADDLAAHAQLRARTAVDIASGETWWGVPQAIAALQAGAADILMPNVQRMGGISGWLQVAGAAELAGVPMAAHVFPELHMHLMCAIPHGLVVEHWPGWPWIWREPLPLQEGMVTPGERPGLGLSPDEGRVARWRTGSVA